MSNAQLFSHMSAEEIAELQRSTGLQLADEFRWSIKDYDRVIAYLRAKAAQRTAPQIPPKCACPKRPRGPMRDVAHLRPSLRYRPT
jgi:hypothetical protein